LQVDILKCRGARGGISVTVGNSHKNTLLSSMAIQEQETPHSGDPLIANR
jgi:Na+-translocating ferredoxin:NAD+ oxidoreductase RnfG subunit